MGAWGSDLLENDAAADAVGYWNEYVERGLGAEPEFWTADRIHGLLRVSYLRNATDAELKNVDRASEILAVGVMLLDAGLTLPVRALELVARAANVQLERAQLREWGSETRRRRITLEGLLQRIGKEPAPEAKRIDPDTLELRKWRVWSKLYPELVHCATNVIAFEDRANGQRYTDLEPPLVRALDHLVRNKEGNRELGQASAETVKHRLMALAFRLGVYLELPEEEVVALIALAEETKGVLYRRHWHKIASTTLREKLSV